MLYIWVSNSKTRSTGLYSSLSNIPDPMYPFLQMRKLICKLRLRGLRNLSRFSQLGSWSPHTYAVSWGSLLARGGAGSVPVGILRLSWLSAQTAERRLPDEPAAPLHKLSGVASSVPCLKVADKELNKRTTVPS